MSLAVFQLTQNIALGLVGPNYFPVCMCVNGLGKTSQLYMLRGSNCLFLHACIVINLEGPGSELSPWMP